MQTAPLSADTHLHLPCLESGQRRYEAIRPRVLRGERPASQRAEEPPRPPDTGREGLRRVQHQGLRGLWPAPTAVAPPTRGQALPVAGLEDRTRLQALSTGFGERELARMLGHTTPERVDDTTSNTRWLPRPGPVLGERARPASHAQRAPGRLEVRTR